MVKVASFLQLGDYCQRPTDALPAVLHYLVKLQQDLELPTTLRELNVNRDSLRLLAEQATKVTRLLSNTPYHLTKKKIELIYENAYDGVL